MVLGVMTDPNLFKELVLPPTSTGCACEFDIARFADGETRILKASDGRKLAAYLVGPRWGTPVICMAGNPSSRFGPRPTLDRLEENGILYIGVDRAGFGESDDNPGHTVKDTAHDVEVIANQLGLERFGIVVLSGAVAHGVGCAALMGERVASIVAFAGRAPRSAEAEIDWAGEATKHNEVIHTSAQEALDDPSQYQTVLGDLAVKAALFRQNPLNFITHVKESLKPGQASDLIDGGFALEIAAGVATGVGNGEGWTQNVLALQRDWGCNTRDITAPVIIWRGGRDPFSNEDHSRWLYEHIPNAWFFRSEEAGHFAAINQTLSAMQFNRDIMLGMRKAWLGRQLCMRALADRSKPSPLNMVGHGTITGGLIQTKVIDVRDRLMSELVGQSVGQLSYRPPINPYDDIRLPDHELAAKYPDLWDRQAEAPFTSVAEYIRACLPGVLPPVSYNS